MDWKPIADRVILKSDAKDVSTGGIVLPGKMEKEKGTVVAVGPGVYDSRTGNTVPTVVLVGDEVVLPMEARYEQVTLDDVKYIICREVDLLAYRTPPLDEKAIHSALLVTEGFPEQEGANAD